MLDIFKKKLSVDKGAECLSTLVENTLANFKTADAEKFKNNLSIEKNLLLLAIIAIDGLMKNTPSSSWRDNKISIMKIFYTNCAKLVNENINDFMSSVATELQYYNNGLQNEMASILKLRSKEDRVIAVAKKSGHLFANKCDEPNNADIQLLGAGTLSAIELLCENLFMKTRIIK